MRDAAPSMSWLLVAILAFAGAGAAACDGPGGPRLGGTQSPLGEVDTSYAVDAVPGIVDFAVRVDELAEGVSTLVVSCTVTDQAMLELAPQIPGTEVSGSSVTGGGRVRLTSEGIANVYDEGELILIKYDARVGDSWSIDRGGATITRTVTAVSEADDYPWNDVLIKTAVTEETGRPIPGVTKVEYRTNHRFGLVAISVTFDDGSTKSVNIVGSTTN